jgi:hypothetical protein
VTTPPRKALTRIHLVGMAAAALAAVTISAAISVSALDSTSPNRARTVGPPADAAAAGAAVAARAPSTVDIPGDPGELVFSTFLGGREWDEATGVATDAAGNTYLTGFTLSANFPVAGAGRRQGSIVDAFVTKIAADRSRIIWSTQLGGLDMDSATAITLDRAGNVYVTGRTGSPNFPTVRALQGSLRGRACTGEPCHDAFVTKLSPAGRIIWSTYFGGSRNEEALGIAVGRDRSVYITGLTDSLDLPVANALQRRFGSLPCKGDLPCPYDAFVTKLSANGARIAYSTYLGGDDSDVARAIALDNAGSAYVTGSTNSANFPTARAFQNTLRGRACGPPPGEPCRQAFLTKLTPRGSTAAYSTYLGGREHDDGFGVAVDARGRAHVTGSTQSSDFPTRRPILRRLDNSACTSEQPEELCDDGFVTKFTRSGRALAYSTYLGGRAEDQGLSIALDPAGRALVGGRTDSTDFPTRNAAQPGFGGYIDGFATKFRRTGRLAWSSFLGGTDADRTTGITADRDGDAHIVGRTLSPDFPTVKPVQPKLKDDDYDAFASIIK